jgi:hypothetical protein
VICCRYIILIQPKQSCHPKTPSDPTSNPGWIITHTDTHTPPYITLTTWIQHTTISQQSTCGIMQTTLINVTQIYIHSVQATVNYSWNLFPHHSTTIMHQLYNTQTEVSVKYSAWQRPKHAICQDTCSVPICTCFYKIFLKQKLIITPKEFSRLIQIITTTPQLRTGKN